MNRIQEVTERLNVYKERLYVARQCPIVDPDQIQFYQDEITEMESEIAVYELKEELKFDPEHKVIWTLPTDCDEIALSCINSGCKIISINRKFNWWRLKMFWIIKFETEVIIKKDE